MIALLSLAQWSNVRQRYLTASFRGVGRIAKFLKGTSKFSKGKIMNAVATILVIAVLLTSSAKVASAEDLPDARPGLWEISNYKEDGTKLQTSTRCIDAASGARLREFVNRPESKKACPKNETRKKGDGYESYSECKIMGSTTITNAYTSGDFNSAYTTTITTTMNPPLMGTAKRVSRSESKWLGECPANMKPGDVSVAGRAPENGIDSTLHVQKIHDQLRKSDSSFDKLVKQFEQGTIPAPQGEGVRIRAKPE